MLELAKKITALTGSHSPISFHPLPSDDPKRRQPDISLARKLLNWEPVLSLDEGLSKTIVYFDQLLTQDTTSSRCF